MCTKSQNPGILREIFPKRPDIRVTRIYPGNLGTQPTITHSSRNNLMGWDKLSVPLKSGMGWDILLVLVLQPPTMPRTPPTRKQTPFNTIQYQKLFNQILTKPNSCRYTCSYVKPIYITKKQRLLTNLDTQNIEVTNSWQTHNESIFGHWSHYPTQFSNFPELTNWWAHWGVMKVNNFTTWWAH